MKTVFLRVQWFRSVTGLLTILCQLVPWTTSYKPMDSDIPLEECYTVDVRRECFSYPLNWHTSFKWAQQFCTNRHSTLVAVKSPEMQSAVEQFVELGKYHSDSLIGAQQHIETKWTWTNQIPFHEGYGPIVNESTAPDARIKAGVLVEGEKVKFVARHPTDSLPHICQFPAGTTKCTTSTAHYTHGGWCYVAYVDHLKSWYSARNFCLRNNGDLAVFNDRDDIVTMWLVSTQPYWVGLRRGWWTWLNGEEMLYSHWAAGQPAVDDSKQCVVASNDNAWKWTTWDCTDKSPAFICQLVTRASAGSQFSFIWILLAFVMTLIIFSRRHSIIRYFCK